MSEACSETGRVFSVGGGYIARVAILEGEGVAFDEVPTVEDVAARWSQVMQVGPDSAEFTSGVFDQTGKIVGALGIELG